jgi:hypothetical protein
MTILLIVLVPLIALCIWAAVFDLKRRRRRAPLTTHDISAAAVRARADADARGGSPGGGGPGGGGFGGTPGM